MLVLQVLANGILLGGLYAVVALGLALVWGVLDIINLAHGAFIMLGGYIAYYLFTGLGLDPFAALPLVMLAMFVIGYLIQWGILNFLVRAPMFNMLLVTFGIDVVLTYLAQILFSADLRAIRPSYAGSNFAVLGVTIPWANLMAFVVALLLTGLLALFLQRHRWGRAIRATAQNLDAARLHGVPPRFAYALTFGIGAAIAGGAGTLYGVVAQLTPYVGVPLTAKSFAIAIIGGLDNPLGVIVGGLVLGLAEAFGSLWLGPTYRDAVSLGLLVLVLIVRPTGILGRTV
ncbi:MAG: branched-chain amino acid ABC transporter permease [Deinococcales bacterium]